MAESTTRKLAVILHADVVGSSSLVHQNETVAHQRIKDVFGRFSGAIASYGGTTQELRGDALLAEFARASDAVCAAVSFQAENTIFNASLKDGLQPRLRIGIAMGEVVVADNTITGDGVILAQRLEQIAEPGGVCIQGAAYETIPKRFPFIYDELEDQRLKGFAQAVRAYAVKPMEGKPVPPPEPKGSSTPGWEFPDKPSIAVLPFTNMSRDPEQEYFSDGITEDVISGLSKNPDLFVISRNSSFSYKGQPVRVRDVSMELGARYVLEGSVRKANQRIRITAQLVDAVNDRHLWVERYDRYLSDVFAVQDEVVGSIVHALGATDGALERSSRQRSIATSVTDQTAYDCYLKAREYFYRHRDTGFKLAETFYNKAIALDPGFARPYSALAWLYFLRFKHIHSATFESIQDKALELALQSIRLDPNDYRGHWVLGMLHVHERKHAQSLAEFDRALHINGNDANLLAFSSEVLVYCGRKEEALERCQQAIRLNPNCPDWYWWQLGVCFFHLDRYSEALEALERMTAPETARRLLAATYAHLDRLQDAQTEAAAFIKVVPDFSIRKWAQTEPFIDSNDLQRYVEGLRKAGLPE